MEKQNISQYNNNNLSDHNTINNTLSGWANIYYKTIVSGSAPLTEKAKKNDLTQFLTYFTFFSANLTVDSWTPSISKHFQKSLQERKYKSTTINRIFSTIRHFAKWLHKQRPLLAGFPLNGVKDIPEDDPDWNGLTTKQITRIKSACDQRLASCNKANQNPLLEAVIFYTLVNTGLRENELISLNFGNYYARGFHHVRRKGNKVSLKVSLPSEAREYLDKYLFVRKQNGEKLSEESPLIAAKPHTRLSTRAVRLICERLAKQASAHAPEEEKFHFSPHMLRHTFLKRIADKHGVHIAQKMSGNISMNEIFRYTKPSQIEIEEIAENIGI